MAQNIECSAARDRLSPKKWLLSFFSNLFYFEQLNSRSAILKVPHHLLDFFCSELEVVYSLIVSLPVEAGHKLHVAKGAGEFQGLGVLGSDMPFHVAPD